ncbi:MAG: hypothetical protein ACRCSY_09015 [Cetobacterium sp.]
MKLKKLMQEKINESNDSLRTAWEHVSEYPDLKSSSIWLQRRRLTETMIELLKDYEQVDSFCLDTDIFGGTYERLLLFYNKHLDLLELYMEAICGHGELYKVISRKDG